MQACYSGNLSQIGNRKVSKVLREKVIAEHLNVDQSIVSSIIREFEQDGTITKELSLEKSRNMSVVVLEI